MTDIIRCWPIYSRAARHAIRHALHASVGLPRPVAHKVAAVVWHATRWGCVVVPGAFGVGLVAERLVPPQGWLTFGGAQSETIYVVPEPSSILLVGMGVALILALHLYAKRRK